MSSPLFPLPRHKARYRCWLGFTITQDGIRLLVQKGCLPHSPLLLLKSALSFNLLSYKTEIQRVINLDGKPEYITVPVLTDYINRKLPLPGFMSPHFRHFHIGHLTISTVYLLWPVGRDRQHSVVIYSM